jgi:flagellar motor switch protein FliN/FliY
MSESVDYVPFETTVGSREGADARPAELDRLRDVPVELAVEIGRTRMTIGEALALGPGSVVVLDRLADEPVDLLVNGTPIARGEVVVVDEEFGLRITDVVTGEGHGSLATSADRAEPAPAGEVELPGTASPASQPA